MTTQVDQNREDDGRISQAQSGVQPKDTKSIPLRPALDFKSIPLPKGETIVRLEHYRTLNRWYVRPFKGKYNVRLYAITQKAMYDITQEVTT